MPFERRVRFTRMRAVCPELMAGGAALAFITSHGDNVMFPELYPDGSAFEPHQLPDISEGFTFQPSNMVDWLLW